jgi:hypothetical protein
MYVILASINQGPNVRHILEPGRIGDSFHQTLHKRNAACGEEFDTICAALLAYGSALAGNDSLLEVWTATDVHIVDFRRTVIYTDNASEAGEIVRACADLGSWWRVQRMSALAYGLKQKTPA